MATSPFIRSNSQGSCATRPGLFCPAIARLTDVNVEISAFAGIAAKGFRRVFSRMAFASLDVARKGTDMS